MIYIIGVSGVPLYVVYRLIILVILMRWEVLQPYQQCLIKSPITATKHGMFAVSRAESFFQRSISKVANPDVLGSSKLTV